MPGDRASEQVVADAEAGSNFFCRSAGAIFALDTGQGFTLAPDGRMSATDHRIDDDTVMPESFSFKLEDEAGCISLLNHETLEVLMNCRYIPHMVAQSASLIRGYNLWGYGAGSDLPTTGDEGMVQWGDYIDSGWLCPDTKIKRLGADLGLGLFADANLSANQFIGEYAGVLQTGADHDDYGFSYRSLNETSLYLSAKHYGSVMRCCNHSSAPNAKFIHVHHAGFARVVCVTTRPVAKNEQIFVSYGDSYWTSMGVTPTDIAALETSTTDAWAPSEGEVVEALWHSDNKTWYRATVVRIASSLDQGCLCDVCFEFDGEPQLASTVRQILEDSDVKKSGELHCKQPSAAHSRSSEEDDEDQGVDVDSDAELGIFDGI